jgi:FAD/FMN-containing dehydrogenase
MASIDEISLSEDKSLLSVGTGNRWANVYSFLDGTGITVIGGRVAGVGVGGFTLGGGISYFSGKYGWACDNVMAYQVRCCSSDRNTI